MSKNVGRGDCMIRQAEGRGKPPKPESMKVALAGGSQAARRQAMIREMRERQESGR